MDELSCQQAAIYILQLKLRSVHATPACQGCLACVVLTFVSASYAASSLDNVHVNLCILGNILERELFVSLVCDAPDFDATVTIVESCVT